MNDLKFAFRQLLKNPGFTTVAVLTLALGIGANTAIFSFVNTILLRPLPFRDPDKLAMVFENNREAGFHKFDVAAPVIREWRRQSTVFQEFAAADWDGFVLTGGPEPENISGGLISANLFSLLGVAPLMGRDFFPSEDTYGRNQVVLLSFELWQRRF